ncbi:MULTISPECIES: NADPH-dependent F420 reductase [unclassified Pantoea]|uniref:NADPH-dependent F420 reductase n=1 Tax=unclassified Pantoea TaxID=2630326 RepID=UPI00301CC7DF
MKIGMIGSGMIARAVAELALKKGHEIMFSNSRGPETIFTLRRTLGCQAGTVQAAIEFGDVIMIAIPLFACSQLPAHLLKDKTLIDANNYYPERDGHIHELDSHAMTTSEMLAKIIGTSHIVKAFNAIAATDVHRAGKLDGSDKLRSLPVAGDNETDKKKVAEFIRSLGFSVVDAGTLKDSWRFEAGTPVYCVPLDADSLKEQLVRTSR